MDVEQDILIRNGFLSVPAPAANDAQETKAQETKAQETKAQETKAAIATVLTNLAKYGYTVDSKTLAALREADPADLGVWWGEVHKTLRGITGSNRGMGRFIVYKNFPREVLEMSQAEAVFRQIHIYLGVPYDALREIEEARPPLGEISKHTVLTASDETTLPKIFADLMAMPNRWSDNQTVWAKYLARGNGRNAVVFKDFAFKENAITLAVDNFDAMECEPGSGTDVLRLAAGLSSADVSLRETVKFRSFKRPERRRLLALLDGHTNLAEDMAGRSGLWKRFMERLSPGDYRGGNGRFTYQNVVTAYDDLYNGRTKTFAAKVDAQDPTVETLNVLRERPGEYMRRFHRFYALFGEQAVDAFVGVLDTLSTRQLAGFRGYLRTINERVTMIYAPKSIWSKAQVLPKGKVRIAPAHRRRLDVAISQVMAKRLAEAYPEGVALDLRVDQVKLQTNDQKLAEYGRGTSFDIPEAITFLRSASFWENDPSDGVVWYDNGWNFFDENWQSLGACAWNSQYFGSNSWRDADPETAAVFSGDPVNIKDHRGRGCQMADLYLDKLQAKGVRFCVWNVLCYSGKKFSEAKEVLATIQMGEEPEEGNHYEPSRAQMVFPLKAAAMTSYVAYVDLKRRKLVYMDVAFPGSTHSAESNAAHLTRLMPAYVEYLDAVPTVLDVLQDAPSGTMPVLYDDANVSIDGGRAFVFRPLNTANTYERVSVTDLATVGTDG